MKPRVAFATISLLAIAACSNPLDKEFKRETAEADFTRIVKLGKIDTAEASIMAHFMVEHDLIGAQVLEIGATYRDILAESKSFWEQAGREKTKAAATTPAANKNVSIEAVPERENIVQSQWSTSMPYKLRITNKSGVTLKAFKGTFIFVDAFGDPVHEVEYKYLNQLGANKSIDVPITFRVQHILSSNKVVQYSERNPFTVLWREEGVIQ